MTQPDWSGPIPQPATNAGHRGSQQPGEPLRIALVTTELGVGGAERCLTQLAVNLDRARYRPVVFSLKGPPAAGRDELVDRLHEAGVPVRFLYAGGYASAWRVYRRLRELWRAERPDIVQSFLFHANVLATRAARAVGVPAVVTGIRVAEPSRWRAAVERWASRDADRVVCVSQAVAEFAERCIGIPREKLVVIPNAIDMVDAQSQPAENCGWTQPEGAFVVLAIGRLHRQKGFDWLLEVVAGVIDQLPQLRLVIAGDGPERERLVRLARQLGLADRVDFLGWRPDVRPLLQMADLFVLSSRWEGMPNAVLEAMAAGKPIAATRAEGVAELLGPASDRQCIAVGDTEGMRRLILELASDAALRRTLGEENRQRAVSEFSVEQMIARYDQLYTSLL